LSLASLEDCPRGFLGFAALGEMTAPMDEDRTTTSTSKRISRMPTLTGGRHFVVKLRLSDSEHDELRRRATTAGMSVQRFLFDAAMAGSAAQSAERRRARREVQRARLVLTSIANNVNQLAKWANTNHVLPDAFRVALADVRRATTEVAETHRRLGSSFGEPR
jgi:Bacterial mobilisation protein (MobC)